jgi:hypothetical protein
MSTTAEKITRSQALWSADDFDRACDAGVFGQEARLELIHGRITERMGQGHISRIVFVLRLLHAGRCARKERSESLLMESRSPILPSLSGDNWTIERSIPCQVMLYCLWKSLSRLRNVTWVRKLCCMPKQASPTIGWSCQKASRSSFIVCRLRMDIFQ